MTDSIKNMINTYYIGGSPCSGKSTIVEAMTPEQTWMRNPVIQCEEELLIYEEIFEFVLEDLKQIE